MGARGLGEKVTQVLKVSPQAPEAEIIALAARALRKGELVAFPTETVYGLGADAFNPEAVKKIFIAKGRPGDNPLIVHIARPETLKSLVSFLPPLALKAANYFWPGPLTLVLPAHPKVPALVTAGLKTVAVRMPAHPVALALIAEAGVPVAAPSANLSGGPSPTTAVHVLNDLGGKVAFILDAGPTAVGLESTVVGLTASLPTILRPGGISKEELEAVLGEVRLDPDLDKEREGDFKPSSPGMKYTHYAPQTPLYLISGEPEEVGKKIKEFALSCHQQGKKVAALGSKETASFFQAGSSAERPDFFWCLGSRADLKRVAANLYSALRECDAQKCDFILSETFSEEGLGFALMNRLRKAAGNRFLGRSLKEQRVWIF